MKIRLHSGALRKLRAVLFGDMSVIFGLILVVSLFAAFAVFWIMQWSLAYIEWLEGGLRWLPE